MEYEAKIQVLLGYAKEEYPSASSRREGRIMIVNKWKILSLYYSIDILDSILKGFFYIIMI